MSRLKEWCREAFCVGTNYETLGGFGVPGRDRPAWLSDSTIEDATDGFEKWWREHNGDEADEADKAARGAKHIELLLRLLNCAGSSQEIEDARKWLYLIGCLGGSAKSSEDNSRSLSTWELLRALSERRKMLAEVLAMGQSRTAEVKAYTRLVAELEAEVVRRNDLASDTPASRSAASNSERPPIDRLAWLSSFIPGVGWTIDETSSRTTFRASSGKFDLAITPGGEWWIDVDKFAGPSGRATTFEGGARALLVAFNKRRGGQ